MNDNHTISNYKNDDINNFIKILETKKNIISVDEIINKKININQQLFGFFIYFVIFLVIIPIILYKNNFFLILAAYLPNVDLIANLLTWYSGNNGIWSELYTPTALSFYGFLSQTVINYIALLGVTFIIAEEAANTNFYSGWSLGFVMLITTYLLPSHYTSYLMDKCYDRYKNSNVSLMVGIIMTFLIIYGESLILKKFKNKLIAFGKIIRNFPKKI